MCGCPTSPEDVTCSRIVDRHRRSLDRRRRGDGDFKETLRCAKPSRTHGVVNTHLIPIADFVRQPRFRFPDDRKVNSVLAALAAQGRRLRRFHHRPPKTLLGDAIATNMMMMGFAYQKGLLPLTAASIEQAIELNDVSIKMNTQAFRLGRLAAADPGTAGELLKGDRSRRGGQDARRRCRWMRSSRTDRDADGLSERQARTSAIARWSIRCVERRKR